jgi:hypothetical protein
MQTFESWIQERHPEYLEEGWGRLGKMAGTALLAGSMALGGVGCKGKSCPVDSGGDSPVAAQTSHWDYVSPNGIKVKMTNNSMRAVVVMPSELANRYGGQAQKVAQTTLAQYFRQNGGPSYADTLQSFKFHNMEQGNGGVTFNFVFAGDSNEPARLP